MVVLLIRTVHIMCRIVYAFLLVRCVCSWMYGMNSPAVAKLHQLTTDLTEWLVSPCRKMISKWNNGMFDWSVFLAFIVLEILETIVVRVLYMFI